MIMTLEPLLGVAIRVIRLWEFICGMLSPIKMVALQVNGSIYLVEHMKRLNIESQI